MGNADKDTFLAVNIAVLTVSDTRTLDDDRSGDTLVERLEGAGHKLQARDIVKDEIGLIAGKLRQYIDDPEIDVVITTGGTGPAKRDVTVEATLAVVENGHPGDLDHYSYDLAEWEDFKSWCDRLTDLGVDVVWGPGRHGPGNNLFVFFDDPAGNHIELSAEMEKFHDDRVEYVPRRWRPVPASVNLWGGQLASWRKTSESEI